MKYRFLEALDKVVGTERRIRRTNSLGNIKFWISYNGIILKDNVNCEVIWPSLKDQKAAIWEVEPEPIYLWAVCTMEGNSLLFKEKPAQNKDGHWRISSIIDLLSDAFPKDKPQKFELVPIEE